LIPVLEPGETKGWFSKTGTFDLNVGQTKNVDAKVVGEPKLVGELPIPPESYSGGVVEDEDPAGIRVIAQVVELPPPNPAISIEKTVHLNQLPTCRDGSELQYGYKNKVVTYCFEVTNNGDVDLDVVVTDPYLTNKGCSITPHGPINMDPNETKWFKSDCKIFETKTTPATATGTHGTLSVDDTDPAGVAMVPDRTPAICE